MEKSHSECFVMNMFPTWWKHDPLWAYWIHILLL